ncbi:Mu transposase C-terminal domain-containing protein [Paracoccus sp. p4-l81]|uniref:Mu transposase C-terminal domain-containing protein n=1 Tax=Paracoccus sp. p4-l81 TaxID=3342806 RepID=UPI0035B93BBF
MTMRFRLSEVDCVTISGADHILKSQDADGIILQRLDAKDICLPFSHAEFIRLLAAPDVSLKRNHFSSPSAARRLHNDRAYLASLAAPARDNVLWKEAWISAVLAACREGEVKRTEASITAFMPTLTLRVAEIERKSQRPFSPTRVGRAVELRDPPSAKTLLRWLRRYEQLGATPLALLPKKRCSSSYRQKFCAEAKSLIRKGLAQYLARGGPKPSQIVEDMTHDFKAANAQRALDGKAPLAIPCANSIRAAIKNLDAFEVVAQRDGLEVARRKFGFYENGLSAEHPLQRVEIDDCEIDLMSILGESGMLDHLDEDQRAKLEVGRRWICVAIDCATRVVLGFRITDKPSTTAAIDVLRMCTEDRTPIAVAAGCQSGWSQHGTPGATVTDQGSTLISPPFRTAVADLGANSECPPAGAPRLRGRIERLFGTFAFDLLPTLIGRTFSNPVERGDYPSEQTAAYTDDELAKIFTLFVVDIYHNSPHAGLHGETPANAWKRLASEQGVSPPPDANHRRVVFGLEVTRKLDRHGVRAFGINYTCPQLQTLLMQGRQREVAIRIDPQDLTHVSVLIGHDWHTAQAVSRAVWGLSLDEWQRIVRDLRTRFRDEAKLTEHIIFAARKKIRVIDAQARALRRVTPMHLSAADLDRAERHLFLGLEIGPEGTAASGPDPKASTDLLGDVIAPPDRPAATDEPKSNPEDDVPAPSAGRRWRFRRD